MANRKKLVHIHSNVYKNGAPQAPATGVLEKGEIAVNYNATEPALFIENNSGTVVKFNAVQRSEISAINASLESLETSIGTVNGYQINLNGTNTALSGTPSFYAPTASGTANTILASNGANSSPKWIAQSSITAGNATQANKTVGTLTVKKSDGTNLFAFNGSASSSVTLTYSDVGAAPSGHDHGTAATDSYGVVKIGTNAGLKISDGVLSADTGTGANQVAKGNHTHNYAGSSSAGGAANSTKGTLTLNNNAGTAIVSFNGSADSSVTLTYSTVGAAPLSHTHTIGDLPTASSFTSDSSTVPTQKQVKDYVDGLVTAPVNYKGAVTTGAVPASGSTHTGDMYIVATSAISLTTGTSGTGAAQTAEVGDFIIARSNKTWDVIQKNLTGAVTAGADLTANKIVLGNGSRTVKISDKGISDFAAVNHDHGTASTETFGVVKIGGTGSGLKISNGILSADTGTGANQVAKGNHTHNYAGSASAGGAANSTKGTLTINNNAGTAIAVFNGSADTAITLTYSTVGAAAATHDHGTASTESFGVVKIGTSAGLKISDGILSADTGTGANQVAKGNHTHNYAGSASAGGAANSTKGTLTLNNNAGTAVATFNGSADSSVTLTYSMVGAAPSSHSHLIADLPTASTLTSDNSKVPTQKQVKDYVDGLVTAPVNYKGAVTTGAVPASGNTKVGDLYIVTTAAISLTTGTSATGAAQTAETGDFIIARTNKTWDVIQKNLNSAVTATNTLTANKFVLGDGANSVKISTYDANSFASANHDHGTASTSNFGVIKIGTSAGLKISDGILSADTGTGANQVAKGDHTHNYAGSSSAGGAANSTKGTLTIKNNAGTSVATFNGSADSSVTLTYSMVGAAPSSHSHLIADLPTAATFTSDASKVPTQKQVKDYVDGLVASPVNYKGAVTNGAVPASGSTKVGDLYIVQTSAITLTTATSATGAAQTAETGDYIIARTNKTWDVIQKNLNNAVTASGSLTTNKFVYGAGGQIVKASSYDANSFATANHDHGTASTSNFGVIKIGTSAGLKISDGILSADTGTGANQVAAGNHTHNYAGSSSAGGAANSTKGTLTIKNNAGTAIAAFNGSSDTSVTLTYSTVGAAASNHDHGTASTETFGVVKIGGTGSGLKISDGILSADTGTGANQVAKGNHTHSYAGSASAGGAANSTKGTLTINNNAGTAIAAFNGSADTAITLTYSTVGAASATHDHGTAATNSFGVVKIGTNAGLKISNGILSADTGTGSTQVAAGDHTHNYAGSTSAGGAANSTKGTLTLKNNAGTTIAAFNGSSNTAITLSYSTVGAAASSHTHDGADITSAVANATNADKIDGYHVSVVTAMPSTPDANTIYILK